MGYYMRNPDERRMPQTADALKLADRTVQTANRVTQIERALQTPQPFERVARMMMLLARLKVAARQALQTYEDFLKDLSEEGDDSSDDYDRHYDR